VVLSRESELKAGAYPRWMLPAIICGLSFLGGFGLSFHFENKIATAQTSFDIAIAGPARAAPQDGVQTAASGVESESEPDLGIERGERQSRGRIRNLENGRLWVDPRSSGLPWSTLGSVEGLLTFRGNPTRTYHGQGPVPEQPEVLWSVNIGCSNSSVGGAPKQWCGTGWTGQPSVFRPPARQTGSERERESGAATNDAAGSEWWVGIGGYNRSVNFFSPETGDEVYPRFETGDIIKGSITVDPDGFPLVYSGSRDNFFHVVAIDGDSPRELWRLSAASDDPTLWNNDWDSSAVIIDGYLLVGGENSRFYVVELNRGFDANGAVTVDPEVVFSAAGWDGQLLEAVGDNQVSIENSVAVSGQVAYFTNSGGLVQGWDLSGLTDGREPERVFRYWTGDDTDASLIIDGEGMLYVASEYERGNSRSRDLGQVFKLDPSKPDDPLVWSQNAATRLGGGVWATPALYEELLLVATDDGRVVALDRIDGSEVWTLSLPGPLWSSPVVVDRTLLQGDCDGGLRAFDLTGSGSATAAVPPPQLWKVDLNGCIESTPAVWDGRIFVGTRSGRFYGIGDTR